jgi:hypothetical protein
VLSKKFLRQLFLIFTPYVVFLGLIRFKLIRFQTNDDPGYFLISNGTTYGRPSSELLFPGRLVGILIANLETVAPEVNWYPVFMAFSILFALSLLTYGLMATHNFDILNNKVFFTFLILIFCACEFIYRMQFTQTAFFVAFIGAFLLIYSHQKKFASLACFALIVCGVSWRPEAGILGTGFAIFLHFISGIFFSQNHKRSRAPLIKVLSVAILSWAINFALWNKYAFWLNSSIRDYLTYDYFRGILHGSRYLNSPQSLIDAIELKMSANDWDLFKNFYTANSDVFSLEKIETLASNVHSITSIFSPYSLTFFFQGVIYPNMVNIGVILSLGFVISQTHLYKKHLFFWFLVFVSILPIYFLLGMPSRLFVPILVAAGVTMFFVNLRQLEERREILSRVNADVYTSMVNYVTGLILMFLSVIIVQREAQYVAGLQTSDRELTSIREFVSDKPIVSFPSFYSPLVNLDPFSNPSQSLKIWPQVIPIGTSLRTPDSLAKIDALNISPDLFGSVLEDQVYLGVTSNYQSELVKKYLLQHYGVKVSFTAISGIDSSQFQILRIKMD